MNDITESKIINQILDSIYKITQIDPCCIEPDHSFENDLNIKPEEIVSIGKFVTNALKLDFSDSDIYSLHSIKTPRELFKKIISIHKESNNFQKVA